MSNKEGKMMPSNKLTGKIAVITGGNSGIGLASAQLFHAEGAKVAIMGRDGKTIDSALKTLGADSLGFAGDVSSLKDLEAFMSKVAEVRENRHSLRKRRYFIAWDSRRV